jgi:hypothetical protein
MATCGATSVNICCFFFAGVWVSPHRYCVTHDYIPSGHMCATCLRFWTLRYGNSFIPLRQRQIVTSHVEMAKWKPGCCVTFDTSSSWRERKRVINFWTAKLIVRETNCSYVVYKRKNFKCAVLKSL